MEFNCPLCNDDFPSPISFPGPYDDIYSCWPSFITYSKYGHKVSVRATTQGIAIYYGADSLGDGFDSIQVPLSYCPMCGKKLNSSWPKEGAV